MAVKNQKVNVVVIKTIKNIGTTVALALFFGPLGMFL
jgi:hypothetical protein